jgi:hypothetical protein
MAIDDRRERIARAIVAEAEVAHLARLATTEVTFPPVRNARSEGPPWGVGIGFGSSGLRD